MTQTVIGMFDTSDAAHAAEASLIRQGIDRSWVHLTARSSGDTSQPAQSMRGIRNFLSELFGPENSDEAEVYAEEIENGGVLLSVDVPDDAEIEPIQQAMLDAGAIDMNERLEEVQGQESQAEGERLQVVEEEMEVGKRQVGKGQVKVSSRLVETPVEEEVNLKEEHATVRRRPVDKPIRPEEVEARGQEESIEVEETAERPVVSKSARVVEEVEVGKESSESTETVEDTVRHTEVDVEREPASGTSRRRTGKK